MLLALRNLAGLLVSLKRSIGILRYPSMAMLLPFSSIKGPFCVYLMAVLIITEKYIQNFII